MVEIIGILTGIVFPPLFMVEKQCSFDMGWTGTGNMGVFPVPLLPHLRQHNFQVNMGYDREKLFCSAVRAVHHALLSSIHVSEKHLNPVFFKMNVILSRDILYEQKKGFLSSLNKPDIEFEFFCQVFFLKKRPDPTLSLFMVKILK